jgi:hypothetical protein
MLHQQEENFGRHIFFVLWYKLRNKYSHIHRICLWDIMSLYNFYKSTCLYDFLTNNFIILPINSVI